MKYYISVLLMPLLFVPTHLLSAQSTIEVSVQGEHAVEADIIHLNVNLNNRADDVDQAYADHNKQEQDLINILEDEGISSANISFEPISVFTRRRPSPNNPREEYIEQVEVRQSVSVKIEDKEQFVAVQKAFVKAGFDHQRGEFDSSKANEAKEKALRNAVDKAREKAKIITEQAGLKLGKILDITYNENNANQAPVRNRMATSESQNLVTQYSQTITYEASVTVLFATKK